MYFLTLILRPSSSDDDDDSEFNVDNNNSDLEPVDSDEDDPEFAEINSWNRTDLMGDKEDRRRLFAMSEFEREKELAERREKVWACGCCAHMEGRYSTLTIILGLAGCV